MPCIHAWFRCARAFFYSCYNADSVSARVQQRLNKLSSDASPEQRPMQAPSSDHTTYASQKNPNARQQMSQDASSIATLVEKRADRAQPAVKRWAGAICNSCRTHLIEGGKHRPGEPFSFDSLKDAYTRVATPDCEGAE